MSESRPSGALLSNRIGGLEARTALPLVVPPFAALVYPLILEAFHACVTSLVSGHAAAPALRTALAVLLLILALAMPMLALLSAISLGEIQEPSLAQRRARAVALLAVAAPPMFVFLGVELYILKDPVPELWLWAAFWLAAAGLVVFSDSKTKIASLPGAKPAPAGLRVAHGLSALGILVIFLALHLANHLTFVAGPEVYRAVMKTVRRVYRQEVLQPLLIALFLFQVGSGVYLATRASAQPMDRFRSFQIGSGVFLAAYVLGHMNSVFVFGRLYLGIDTDWSFATGAPAGLIKDAWNIRLVPHYGLGVFFVLSHLAAGARAVMLTHGVRKAYADRFLIGSATAAAGLAFVILFGMSGGRLSFALP